MSAQQVEAFERLKCIVAMKGGTCLSAAYRGARTRHKFRCTNGHIWQTQPRNIVEGMWCGRCAADARKLGLEPFHRVAAEHGGECLSTTYVDNDTRLRFRCSQHHEWDALPGSVLNGNWCRKCWTESRKLTLDQVREVARQRGGECLSTVYVDSQTKLHFVCESGHEFDLPSGALNQGAWCRKCHDLSIRSPFDDIRKIIETHGGRVLNTDYVDGQVEFECAKGHQRRDRPYRILKMGLRCMECWLTKRRRTLADMQALAANRGGKCLSSEYTNMQTRLIWECGHGHQWPAVPLSIQRGTWCPVCAMVRKRCQAKMPVAKKWIAMGKSQ